MERAIERIKNYHILDFVPITLCKNGIIDMIFFVCAMLTNFQPPLVKTAEMLLIISMIHYCRIFVAAVKFCTKEYYQIARNLYITFKMNLMILPVRKQILAHIFLGCMLNKQHYCNILSTLWYMLC